MDSSTKLQSDLLDRQGYILDLDEMFVRFASLADKRQTRGKRYKLAVLPIIATWAKLAGCQHTAAITEWARLRSQALVQLFRLPRARMPSLSTWNRVL